MKICEAIAHAKKTNENLKEMDIIGINGVLYDVTNYIKYHPGGEVIKKFINKDSSIVFEAFNHKEEYLDKLTKVGLYESEINPIDKDFLELGKKFEKMGFKEGSKFYFFTRILIVFASLWISFRFFSQFDHFLYHLIGSFFMFIVWQQSGFLMHDAMHSHLFHNPKNDEAVGSFFSSFIFGVNGLWWKEDHNTHHALTGVIDIHEKWIDPQLIEGVWVQNEKMFSFFNNNIQQYLIKLQAFLFVPLNLIVGRYGIMIDSFLVGNYPKARNKYMYIAWLFHWLYIAYFFSFLPSWSRIILMYFIAGMLQGILHLQLLVSHYSKEMLYREEYDKTSWFKYMVNGNLNINCPSWLDWFHGGLHLHIEHHTYPTIPRHYYREMQPYIMELCKKHNIEYEYIGWFEAVWKTLKNLYNTSLKFADYKAKYTPVVFTENKNSDELRPNNQRQSPNQSKTQNPN